MSIDLHNVADEENNPLTRADVEHLLRESGGPEKLDLSGKNMRNIDLRHLNLTGANLTGANLNQADLRNITLKKANLSKAYLRGVDLTEADLTGADLSNAELHRAKLEKLDLSRTNLNGSDLIHIHLEGANLKGLNLSGINMSGAYLSNSNLSRANLSGVSAIQTDFFAANLSGANLSKADLRGASLIRANLIGINLSETKLSQADLTDASISINDEENILHGIGINWSFDPATNEQTRIQNRVLRIRVTENPLTIYNLAMIISALTELSTKCWLIAKERFADLIEYSQTHNARFDEEANLVFIRIRHNSPLEMSIGFPNLDPQNIVDALIVAIDGIAQTKLRFKQAELAIQEKAQEIQFANQQAMHENEMALLEQEKKRLEIESQRLALLEQNLELRKKEIEYGLEIAKIIVDTLHPGADQAIKAMEIQTLLPGILQLQNGKGLELALPTPQKSEDHGISSGNS